MSDNKLKVFINLENLRDSTEKGFIYEITCEGCGAKYIGQTSQTLKDRVKHHFWAAKNPIADSYSNLPFAKHSKESHNGKPLKIHISALWHEEDNDARMALENVLIQERQPELNIKLKASEDLD